MFSSCLVPLLLLLLVPVQVVTRTDPLWHSYTPMPESYDVDKAYKAITTTYIVGSPIKFPSSNTSADYTSFTWFDPCFDRAINHNALFVMFWYIDDDVYCTVHMSNSSANTVPPFSKSQLARVEMAKIRCE